MEKFKNKICWVCDKQGWAFHNNARRLAALMPEYNHIFWFPNEGRGFFTIDQAVKSLKEVNPDLIVVQHPWAFDFCSLTGKPMVFRMACRASRIWKEDE